MAVASAHVLHGINSASPSAFISQISNARASSGINALVAKAAGFPEPLFVGNEHQEPGITFDSTQISTILGITGLTIGSLADGNTDLYFKKLTYLASREADASTVHTRLRMAEAFLLCNRITAGHRQEATAQCRIGAIYDGTNEPIVPAGSLALAGTPTSAEHFFAGPVYVNTTRVNGIESIDIDFGRTLIEVGSDGELYVTFVAEEGIAPVITIRTMDLPWATYGLNGTALTSLSVYLRKQSTTGKVADGTASHIKFAATSGLIVLEESEAGDNNPQMATVKFILKAPNASGSSLTLTNGVAITT